MSAYIDDSLSAFPHPVGAEVPGITKREYYAAQALAGWAAGRPADIMEYKHVAIANACFRYADAMIAASKFAPDPK